MAQGDRLARCLALRTAVARAPPIDLLLSGKLSLDMTISEIARQLGRRGGLTRAKRLSHQRLTDIARMGANARRESRQLARAIRQNFAYVSALHRLRPPTEIRPESASSGPLPGIYDHKSQD